MLKPCFLIIGILLFPVLSIAQSVIEYSSYWDQYLIKNLSMTENNLPNETVFGSFQSSDGFIWIICATGLARYDGISLKFFTARNTSYQGSTLYEMHEDSRGNFWLPTVGEGLMHFDGVDFTHYGQQSGLKTDVIKSMAVSHGDTLWLGTYGAGLQAFYRDSVIASYNSNDGLVNDQVWRLIIDKKNRVWIGTNGGLSIYENGEFTNFTTENGLPFNVIRGLTEMDNGEIWVGTDKEGIVVFEDKEIKTYYNREDGIVDDDPQFFAQNPADGSVWIAYHGNGVDRYHNGTFEPFTTEHGLISGFTTHISFTREGLALIGSEKGVSILKKRKMNVISKERGGLSESAVVNVNQDSSGVIWIGTDGGGFNYKKENEWGVIEFPPEYTNGYASGAATDRIGDIWFNTKGTGVVRIRDYKIIETYTTRDGLLSDFARGIAFDEYNNAWIGTNEGINVIRNDGSVEAFTATDGIPENIMMGALSASDGSVWIASFGGGIIRIKNNEISIYDTDSGLAADKIFALHEDTSGIIWIGGSFSGLTMFDGNTFTNFTTDDGLPESGFNAITEDDFGNLWLASGSAVFKITKQDIHNYNLGINSEIPVTRYSVEDGFPSMSLQIGYNSTATKLKNGELLFATTDGVGVIDPKLFLESAPPVKTYIDEILVDGERTDFTNRIIVKPKNNRIEISYSAFNFDAPSKTAFRVMLEGVDEDWVNMDQRKTVYYDFLPDGDYTFRVSASNADGQWKSENARLSFKVLPPYYKTIWFMSFSLFGFGITIAALVRVRYRFRMDQLNRELAVQQKIQKERERISRDLHDNVGSQITNIITGLEISNLHIERNQNDEAIFVIRNLDTDARNAMTELRETIWLLDQDFILFKEFEKHIKEFIRRQEYCFKDLKISFDSHQVPIGTELNPSQSLHLLRIIQESLNNCRKYSNAKKVKLTTTFEDNRLCVSIKDDGVGMNVNEAKKKGNGLKNIEHRAQELNGTCRIESSPNAGTHIMISFTIIP